MSLAIGFMVLLDVTLVVVALPSMRTGLATDTATIQWVISGYSLTFGMTLVAGGRLGDARGRRPIMVIGLIGYVLAGAAVGLARGVEWVIAARLVQGAMAGRLVPQNTGLIQQLFQGPERGRAYGWFGLTVSVASAGGPVIGGAVLAVTGESGWRWLFAINVPLGLVAVAAVLRLVPAQTEVGKRAGADAATRHIDVVGAGLLGLTVLALLYPIVRLEAGARLPLLLVAAVPVLGLIFLRWERATARRGLPPLLDVTMLRQIPGYRSGFAVGALYFTGFTGLFVVLSLYVQESLGGSPLFTGLLLAPFAVGSAVSSPTAGWLVTRLGRRLIVGALVTVMTGLALTALTIGWGIWWTIGPMFLGGLGSGAVVAPNITLTMAEVPPAIGGAAGGALQTGQRVGAAIGATVLVVVYEVVRATASDLTALRAALLCGVVIMGVALAASWPRGALADARPAAD